jgi:heat shock protein HslJ
MKIVIIVTSFLLAFQCNNKPDTATEPSLDNTWVLVELIDFTPKIEGNKGRPTLKLDFQDSSYSGHTGCNSYRGKVDFSKGEVRLKPALMTKMACDDHGLEKAYMAVLNSFNTYKVENRQLKLFTGDKLIAVFSLSE